MTQNSLDLFRKQHRSHPVTSSLDSNAVFSLSSTSRHPRESGDLARIFHADLLRKPGSLMDAALDSDVDLGSMYAYSPASTCSPALPHRLSRLPRHDQYEIFGLDKNKRGWIPAFAGMTEREAVLASSSIPYTLRVCASHAWHYIDYIFI